MSLEALSQAFVALGEPGSSAKSSRSNAQTDTEQAAAGHADEVTPQRLLEAILFVGRPDNQPLECRAIAEIMESIALAEPVAPQEVETLVGELNAEYEANGCPYTIASEGEGFRLVLREEFSAVRDRYQRRVRAARLSPAAIEVLAMVAYRGPLTADEVSRLRGTPGGHILRQLVGRQLLRIERPQEKPRKAIYHTTERFLAVFGLATLNDLPKSEELAGR